MVPTKASEGGPLFHGGQFVSDFRLKYAVRRTEYYVTGLLDPGGPPLVNVLRANVRPAA